MDNFGETKANNMERHIAKRKQNKRNGKNAECSKRTV